MPATSRVPSVVLAGLAALLLAPAATLVAPSPPALAHGDEDGEPLPEDLVGEAKKLYEEARTLFREAADVDLSQDERRKARQGSYRRLQRAQRCLETHLELHPEDEPKLSRLSGDIAVTMFWLRKEAAVGELGGVKPSAPPPKPEPAPGPGPAGAPAAGATPPEPEAPKGPTPESALAEIREYEKEHPADIPGLHERYTGFLADFPDGSTKEFQAAAKRVEELGARMKDVYRLARDDDPDALAGVDDAEVVRLLEELVEDLRSPDAAVRERAARTMGSLGSGKAAQPLIGALSTENEVPVIEAAMEALAKIGGRRVCERLAREKPSSALGPMIVEVFCRMVRKGGVNARIAGERLALYAAELDDQTKARVGEVLFEAGRDGALGLSLVVDACPVEKKVPYIQHIGEMGDPRVTGNLAAFLVVNPQGARRAQLAAAKTAIEKIGKPGVRYLIPALDDERNRVWTAEVLRQITGAKPRDDKRKTWEKWFRSHRRELE